MPGADPSDSRLHMGLILPIRWQDSGFPCLEPSLFIPKPWAPPAVGVITGSPEDPQGRAGVCLLGSWGYQKGRKGFQRRRGECQPGPPADCKRSWHVSSVWTRRCECCGSTGRKLGCGQARVGVGAGCTGKEKGWAQAQSEITADGAGWQTEPCALLPVLFTDRSSAVRVVFLGCSWGGEPKVLLLCHLESAPLSCPLSLEALWGDSKLAEWRFRLSHPTFCK